MALRASSQTGLAIIGLLCLVGIYGAYSRNTDDPQNAILPQQMVYSIVPGSTAPIQPNLLELNADREKAGLPALSTSNTQARTTLQIDNIDMVLLLGPDNKILVSHIENRTIPSTLFTEEYSVRRGRVSGPAAFWRNNGQGHILFQTSHYDKGIISGPTVYYDDNGNEIGRIDFVNGQPFDGQLIERQPNGTLTAITHYKDGYIHGAQEIYTQGKLDTRLNFTNGKQAGLQQFFAQGRLLNEKIIEDGITRLSRNYDENEKIIITRYFDKRGRPDGPYIRFDESGNLIVDQCFQHGAKHGLYWTRGKRRLWFWKNELLGENKVGQTRFMTKYRHNRHKIYCPFSDNTYSSEYKQDERYTPPIVSESP